MFASLSTRARRALAISALSGAGLVVAAACSSGTPSSTSATGPVPTATQTGSHSATSIAVGRSSLGTIVVDNAGRTLYRFDKDTPGSGSSACTGACAAAWPPDLVQGAPTAGPGVTGTLGVVTRADGTHQLTLDGHPLYRYVGDQGRGDTTGDGFGGIWHVVHTATSTSAAGASTGSGSSAW
jgi:predicted lipoprotein with Yx(FWY)xxD motif